MLNNLELPARRNGASALASPEGPLQDWRGDNARDSGEPY